MYILLASIVVAFSKFVLGPCPHVPTQQNFNIERYMGKWYEIIRNAQSPFEFGTCTEANYSIDDQKQLKIYNSEVRDQQRVGADGKGYCEKNVGQCWIYFSDWMPYASYRVIETDYDNYSIVFSCQNFYAFHIEYGWVLSRKKDFQVQLDNNTLTKLTNLQKEDLYLQTHQNCNVTKETKLEL